MLITQKLHAARNHNERTFHTWQQPDNLLHLKLKALVQDAISFINHKTLKILVHKFRRVL